MATYTIRKPASRRPLRQARLTNPDYEIVIRRKVSARTAWRGLLDAAGAGIAWGAGVLGTAYAEGARVVLDRLEAAEDAAAERRHRAHLHDERAEPAGPARRPAALPPPAAPP